MLPFFLPLKTTVPTRPAVNGCLKSNSSMTVCAFATSWPPGTPIMFPVPPVSSTGPPWKRPRYEHGMMQFRAQETNQFKPAIRNHRDESVLDKPRLAAIANGANCKICGTDGRLAKCDFCKELGCKKCNYWCSEKKGGCGLTICADCNDFDGAVTQSHKGLWQCSNCKAPEPLQKKRKVLRNV